MNVPFDLGSQFDEYEFDVEFRTEFKVENLVYDVYTYTKPDIQQIADIPITGEILLFFNLDILEGKVILKNDKITYSVFSDKLKLVDYKYLTGCEF